MKAKVVLCIGIFLFTMSLAPLVVRAAEIGGTHEINGTQLYVEQAGEGSPLLLLHFFGGCVQSWAPHVPELARHYRLILVDLPGHGRSTNPSGQFTHRQSARDVFALLDELRIERFKAMGMSSGGMTLLHMATQQPERIEAMVLIGATSYFPDTAREIMQQSLPDRLPQNERELIDSCSSRGTEQSLEIINQFHQMKDSYDDMNFTQPYLSTITAGTFIVHGDRDEFFPVDIAADMYKAIPNSYLWIVPNGGHIPIFDEEAATFRTQALAFLNGSWSRSGVQRVTNGSD